MRGVSGVVVGVAVAAAVIVGLGACSATPAANPGTSVAACRQGAGAAHLPAATAQPQPGGVRWATQLASCVSDSGQRWPLESTTRYAAWATPVPGVGLAVYFDGAVTMYSDTGTTMWQRTVQPATGGARFTKLTASQSLLLVEFTAPAGSTTVLSTFLNTADGRPVGSPNAALPGDPFLVGSHVVLRSTTANTLSGYDPAGGRTLWSTGVPSAPAADAAIDDGSIVYLDSAASSGDFPPAMQRIDRLDAATGRLLAPLTLPHALNFDLSTDGGNAYAQGLLVLDITPPCSGTGCAITQTVAVRPSTGAIAWSHDGDVVPAAGGLFSTASTGGTPSGSMTTVDPATGQDVWTLTDSSLGTEGGPEPQVQRSGYAAAWTDAGDANSAVIGIDPATGKQLWSSPKLATSVFVTTDAANVYVVSCTPWGGGESDLCAHLSVFAIAA